MQVEKEMTELWNSVVLHAQKFVLGLGGLLPAAVIARVLVHRRIVQAGHRRFWSWALIRELPTAVFCAILGGGLAEWWGLGSLAASALVGAVAWLGPRGVEAAVLMALRRGGKL